jgi:thiol-disulfide isomerase/thioredoxin
MPCRNTVNANSGQFGPEERIVKSAGMVSVLAAGVVLLAGAAVAAGVGAAAPELKAKIVSGDAVSTVFADHKGKPVVVEFWATWCPPCRRSIPHLNELWKTYKDKAVFIGLSSEDEAVVTKFVKAQKAMEYPVAVDTGKTAEAYGVTGIPNAFVVVDGKIAWRGHPMMGLDDAIKKAVDGASAEKPVSAEKTATEKK